MEHAPRLQPAPRIAGERTAAIVPERMTSLSGQSSETKRRSPHTLDEGHHKPATERSHQRAGRLSAERIHRMDKADLLSAAATVAVGETSLKDLAEQYDLATDSLRRLLVEHNQGGNLKESLAREMLEHELRYEKDPASAVATELAAGQAGSQASAVSNDVAASGMTAEEQAIARYEQHEAQRVKQARRRFDHWFAGITAIVVLLLLVALFAGH